MPKVVSTSPLDSNNRVVCFAHNLEASRKTSQTQSNPARDFYCCSKPFSDPDRCKFFYWAEQIDSLRPESQDMNNSPRKRVNSNDATGSSLQKRSKLGDSMSAAQTPAQKRLKEIQKVLGVAPCLSSDDEEDEDQVFDPSQHATQSKFPRLLTPPSTSSRQNLFLPQSPSPLPRNGKGKEQDMVKQLGCGKTLLLTYL
ncbi:hypothetical protein C8J56DRAFT_433592 [Mycena floridula]|nr:hypothetical protein C8J56DRAFT_433592 [Mycena floridula]